MRLEKEARARQLEDEKQRRKNEHRAEFQQDQEVVNRLKDDMENERRAMAMKRMQERNFLKRMMAENEANKRHQ